MKRTRATRSTAAETFAAPLGGQPDLTPEAYWAADGGRAKQLYGVLEVNTGMAGCDARHVYVRSVFWGLASELEAHALATKGNAVRASYDPKRQQRQQRLVAHAHPDVRPWFETTPGVRWRLPPTLALAHQADVLDEMLNFFTDTYLPTVPKKRRAEERSVFAYLQKAARDAAQALPSAFWAMRPGVFAERLDDAMNAQTSLALNETGDEASGSVVSQ